MGIVQAIKKWVDAVVSGPEFERVLKMVEDRCRKHSIYMLGPEKARFLHSLILRVKPRCVIECGTAIGYSGLHIADALRQSGEGRLITVEVDHERAMEAEQNFYRAGVGDLIEVRTGDAAVVLKEVYEAVDFLFLDNSYSNYHPCLLSIMPRLKDGATIVADNVGIGALGMADYLTYVRSHFESRSHWFELDLPWASRDAMEVTSYTT
jgi:predicted O-methyltransferase YrrM